MPRALSASEVLPKLTLVVLLCAFGRNCTPDCGYNARCAENVLQTCSIGVDQCVGPQARHETPCEGLNPVCVTVEQDVTALCAVSSVTPCPGATCEGAVARRCVFGHTVAEDCATRGNTCVMSPEGLAVCALGPNDTCQPATDLSRCEGDVLVACALGYWARSFDCATVGLRCVDGANAEESARCVARP